MDSRKREERRERKQAHPGHLEWPSTSYMMLQPFVWSRLAHEDILFDPFDPLGERLEIYLFGFEPAGYPPI
jgi:hypothetical protein